MALCTPTDNNNIRISSLKNYLLCIFFWFFFIFIIMRVYTHRWIISNHSNILKEKNQWKKCFLQNISFPLYHRSSVPSLITLLFEKVFHEKTFHKIYFSRKIIFKYFYLSCVPRWVFIANLSNFWSFWKWFSVKKRKQALKKIFFLSLLLCTVLITVSFKKTFLGNNFREKFFFLKYTFLQHSWITHLIIFTKPFKKRFSWKYFSITKRITRKTVFLFPALALCTPTNNKVFQNSFLKKHYLKIFFLVFFLFIILRVHTHWWIIPNQSKILKENKNQWQKYFLHTLILLLYHR